MCQQRLENTHGEKLLKWIELTQLWTWHHLNPCYLRRCWNVKGEWAGWREVDHSPWGRTQHWIFSPCIFNSPTWVQKVCNSKSFKWNSCNQNNLSFKSLQLITVALWWGRDSDGNWWTTKNTGHSLRGPRFSFQRPHRGSRMSVTPAPWNPVPFSGFWWHCTQLVHRHTRRQNIQKTNTHNKINTHTQNENE